MDIIETVSNGMRGYNKFSIGKSECGNDILCAHRGGYGGKQLIVIGGIHARECYTALVVLEQIAAFGTGGADGAYFIPLVNPDGALFFETGDAQCSEFLARHVDEHRAWKANALGVDLNNNFDANWGTGAQNRRSPYSHGYIGEYPASAKEVRALVDFTLNVRPNATISYHMMGGELYWEFFQTGERKRRDKAFATALADYIDVRRVDGDLGSAGGYKDWCVQYLHIPAVTIELIKQGSHPFEAADLALEIPLNAGLPRYALSVLKESEQGK